MARRHCFQMRLIPMTNTHNATMEELVIGKDLSWMDGFPSAHELTVESAWVGSQRPAVNSSRL